MYIREKTILFLRVSNDKFYRMRVEKGGISSENLIKDIQELCEKFQVCRIDEKAREECFDVKRRLVELCSEGRMKIAGADAGLLVALMDAYEVTRDEGMLQEVLDAVSERTEELEATPLHVKLLSYCYFYTEDEECAGLAKRMLERLKSDRNVPEAELEKASEIYGELVEEAGY